MKRVVTRYAAIGCVQGCQHRPGDIEELHIERSQKTREEYEVLTISPQCDRVADVAGRRSGIYARASTAADCAADKCKSLRGKIKARQRAWNAVTEEWKQEPCPFAEAPPQ